MKELTQKELKSFLRYVAHTGKLYWLVKPSKRVNIGDEAGGLQPDGYVTIKVNGGRHQAHRLVWLYVNGEFPNDFIDHINGIKNDNRIVNLRDVTHAENLKNQTISKRNTSGVNGVSWHDKNSVWQVHVGVNNKRIHIGVFKCKLDAVAAMLSARKEYGFHDNHGKNRLDNKQ